MKVVVVGSGIAGAATAFALARRGVAVTVVDSGNAGQATAAGAGIIEPWSSNHTGRIYALHEAGAVYYAKLLDRLGEVGVDDVGYERSGTLVVDNDPDRLDETERTVRARAATCPQVGEVERLDADEARRAFPPLRPDLSAISISGGARVDGRLLRAGLLDGAVRHAAEVEHATAHLTRDRVGRSIVTTTDGVLAADAVVLATGAWTNQLLTPLHHRIPVEPQRGQLSHLRVEGVQTTGWPTVLSGTHYIVPFPDGRVVVGATREMDSGFDSRVTAEGQRKILSDALDTAPGLWNATLLESRVGLRPVSSTGIPIIGGVEELPGVFVNAGFGAFGLTMGPAIGEMLADLILGEEAPLISSPISIGI